MTKEAGNGAAAEEAGEVTSPGRAFVLRNLTPVHDVFQFLTA